MSGCRPRAEGPVECAVVRDLRERRKAPRSLRAHRRGRDGREMTGHRQRCAATADLPVHHTRWSGPDKAQPRTEKVVLGGSRRPRPAAPVTVRPLGSRALLLRDWEPSPRRLRPRNADGPGVGARTAPGRLPGRTITAYSADTSRIHLVDDRYGRSTPPRPPTTVCATDPCAARTSRRPREVGARANTARARKVAVRAPVRSRTRASEQHRSDQPMGSGIGTTSYAREISRPAAGSASWTRQRPANWFTPCSIGIVPEISTVPGSSSPRPRSTFAQ